MPYDEAVFGLQVAMLDNHLSVVARVEILHPLDGLHVGECDVRQSGPPEKKKGWDE